jgi:hypothetical protein
MQKLTCGLFIGVLYVLSFSVALVESARKTSDHFLIGNATSSEASVKDSDADAPWNYKGIEGGPACIVESSNASESSEINAYIRHDNIRSMSFGTGYDEHTSVDCIGEVADFCTAWTSDSRPRNDTRSCAALAEDCPCEPDTHRIISKAHIKVTKDVKEMCYTAPDKRDLYSDPFRILIVGLNSGALPMYLMANCRVFVPGGLKLSIVEPDSRVVDLAHDLFGFSAVSNVAELEKADPKKAVLERLLEPNHVQYDVVIIDLSDGSGGVPESVQGPAFLEGIDRLLRAGSKVIQYVPTVSLNLTKGDYISVFGQDHIQEFQTGMTADAGPEHIIVAYGPPVLAKSSSHAPAMGKALITFTLCIMAQMW